MFTILLLLVILPSIAFGAPEVVDSGKKCPAASSSSYASFPYSEQQDTYQFLTQLLQISVVQQNGTVLKVYSVNVPFSFGTKPLAQYVAGFTEPIKGSKAVTSDLAKLVSGSESNFLGGASRVFLIDNCALKNSTTLPNIVVRLGDAQKSADLVLKPSDYVIQHPTQGYCYFAFYYLTSNDWFSSTDYQARQFCAVVDTAAKTVGFARPLA